MREDLNYEFIDKLKTLSFIHEIWLFGSRSRGDNRTKSDIDLAIICPNATENDWIKILDIIEDADTLLKVDCLRFDKEQMDVALYENILKEKKVIYVKEQN